MNGFLTGSQAVPQKNAYKSCASCISDEQSAPTPSILAATAHPKSGIETFAGKSYTQQYAVNYSLPE
jgi:hypothetical protein